MFENEQEQQRVQEAVAQQQTGVQQTLTRDELQMKISHLQWVISRQEGYVPETHEELEGLYGLLDKMDELDQQ